MADFDWTSEELAAVDQALRDHADWRPGHILPGLDFGADIALAALRPFVEKRLQQAWNEGYDAGHPAAHAANPEWPRAPRNPYRKEDS